MNIRKKDNYMGLVKSEKYREFKSNCSLCFKIGFPIILLWVICYTIAQFVNYLLDMFSISFNINHIGFFLLFMTSFCMGVYIALTKKEFDSLNQFYSYLPLDRIDIKNNNLTSWKSYILCIYELSNKILDNEFKRFGIISERVRFDILEIMTQEYNITQEIRDILNNNFETFIFKCDTEEKIDNLLGYYSYQLSKKSDDEKWKAVYNGIMTNI